MAYYSLELLLSHELSKEDDKRLKAQELSLSREASFIIIQDEERALLLAKDNQISLNKFILVPNAPLGPARRQRCDYWHQRFGLSSNCRIVLHAGSVGKWTGLEDIVRSVSSWPDDWILVVHTYIDPTSKDVKRLQEMAIPTRVLFSLNPVSHQQLEMLIDAADIGVAFYVGVGDSWYTGQNMQTIGLSSGKIACYLRAGLPVIVNESASISELLQHEGCGISVNGRKDIGSAITQISQNYEQYSRQACRMFEKHLDFAGAFRQVIERIDSLKKEGIPTSDEIALKDQAIP
jgi:glycosyltransferase involved in cell wall biosynthesis